MDTQIRGAAEQARTPGGVMGSLWSGPPAGLWGGTAVAPHSLSSEPRNATRVCRHASMRRKWRNSGFTCLLGGGASSGTLRHRAVSGMGTGGHSAMGVAERTPPPPIPLAGHHRGGVMGPGCRASPRTTTLCVPRRPHGDPAHPTGTHERPRQGHQDPTPYTGNPLTPQKHPPLHRDLTPWGTP